MAAPKRNKIQRENDLELTASLYLRGVQQADIARKLGVTQPQVSYDLKLLQRRWLESSLVDINEVKAKELAKVDELEREYWRAWRRSRKEASRTSAINRQTSNGNSAEARVEKQERVGDARFLAGVQWCIDKRCVIFGLNAATKLEVKDWREEARRDGVQDVDGLFEQLVRAAMDRGSEGGGVGGSSAAEGGLDGAAGVGTAPGSSDNGL